MLLPFSESYAEERGGLVFELKLDKLLSGSFDSLGPSQTTGELGMWQKDEESIHVRSIAASRSTRLS